MVNLKFGPFFDKSCQNPTDMTTFSAHDLLWLESSGGPQDLSSTTTSLTHDPRNTEVSCGSPCAYGTMRSSPGLKRMRWCRGRGDRHTQQSAWHRAEIQRRLLSTPQLKGCILNAVLWVYTGRPHAARIPDSRSVLFLDQNMQEGRWKWKDTSGLLQSGNCHPPIAARTKHDNGKEEAWNSTLT